MDDDFGKVPSKGGTKGNGTGGPESDGKLSSNGKAKVENKVSGDLSTGEKTPGSTKDVQPTSAVPKEGDQVKLPQRFVVKYLGFRQTSNLWGIKYTRKPVDEMVAEAKTMLASNREKSLPLLKLEVNEDGVTLGPMPQNNNPECPTGKFLIESISYGVQDLVFTRVFAMIVVKAPITTEESGGGAGNKIRLSNIGKATNPGDPTPFQCHAFVCDSRQTARRLTYSLATAFHKFSKQVAAGKLSFPKAKKFAIDLRPAQDIEADLLDSEA